MLWLGENAPPSLPDAVIVDFGDKYTGEPIFGSSKERRGWVPIVPERSTCGKKWRRQIPLRLSSAWTPWKAQGETLTSQIVADLGKTERVAGKSYTIFSRARSIQQIGLPSGLDTRRLMEGISRSAALQRRKIEQERLRLLSVETRERWTFEEAATVKIVKDARGDGN